MQNLPIYVYITFGVTVLAAIWLFFKASKFSKPIIVGLLSWIILQSSLAISGFYNNPATMTMRFTLLFLPALLFILSLFLTKKGRQLIDGFDLPTLTLISVIRIPVEIVLFWLLTHHLIPQAMTFEGRNWDIFSGITAPFIYYFGFVKKSLSNKVMIIWNFICLILLVNVVSNALLSLPERFQQFGFDQPNTGLGFFPFMLLPAFLVPLVLFSMLASLRQLIKDKPGNSKKIKISEDFKKLAAFGLIIGVFTSSYVTFLGTGVKQGFFTENFFPNWISLIPKAYIVVTPFILLTGPIVRKLVDKLFSIGKSN